MKSYWIAVVSTFLLASCGGGGQPTHTSHHGSAVYAIDLEQALQTTQTVPLSHIADSVEYILLKTPQAMPLGSVRQVDATKEFVFVTVADGIHQFDRRGHYIRPIGRIGRGPKEYQVPSMAVSQAERKIYVPNCPKILAFSFDSQEVEQIEWAHSSADEIFVDQGVIYAAFQTWDGISKSRLLGFNRQKDTILHIPNYHALDDIQVEVAMLSNFSNPAYRYNGSLFYKGFAADDTVFRLANNTYNPHATIDMGRFKCPLPTHMEAVFHQLNAGGDYYQINTFGEDDLYLHLVCAPFGNPELGHPYVLFDKKTQQGFKLQDAQGKAGFTDDLNGGAPFVPGLFKEDCYVSVADAVEFIEANGHRKEAAPKLKQFLGTITPQSNPIVTIVRCKK